MGWPTTLPVPRVFNPCCRSEKERIVNQQPLAVCESPARVENPCHDEPNLQRSSRLDIVILGLSITSSWGNGHATTYRGLVRELTRRGHRVLFLERDMPWYAGNRDMPNPPYGRTELYTSLAE